MDRALKERLIGATVLVVVMVLVVPVFLDGSPTDSSAAPAMIEQPVDLPGRHPDKGARTVVLDRRRSEPRPARRRAAPLADEAAAPAAGIAAAPPGADPKRSATGLWAVQLGSFSSQANADRLAAELRQQGFAAFLSRLETPDGELHRVRVGPQRDRDSAQAMVTRLKRAGQKGRVVPHP